MGVEKGGEKERMLAIGLAFSLQDSLPLALKKIVWVYGPPDLEAFISSATPRIFHGAGEFPGLKVMS